tara:strand:- start:50 stop:394 length:345 start_codon:yes stop_codon:yes gene_type:complete
MGTKKLLKKIGRNIQAGGGQLVRSAGRGAGAVLGAAAGKAILSGIATYGPEVAEGAAIALKTGGYIAGPRNKPRLAILHGGESVIPANAKVTKKQKSVIASNKKKQKMGSFVYN